MRVFITSAYPDPEPVGRFRVLASDPGNPYALVTEPEAADLILFVENAQYHYDMEYRALRSHPLVKQFPENCFMYNEQINPWCVLPGLYTNVLRRYYDRNRQRASCYVRDMNPHIRDADFTSEPSLLFSFLGNRSGRIRRLIFQLEHTSAIVEDTSSFNAFHAGGGEAHEVRQHRYADVMSDSKFILCPRGAGASSFRLYEAMHAGRCPVLISDDWVEPAGPDYRFLVRVRERDIARIGKILEAMDHEWIDRGKAARAAWDQWFTPTVRVRRMLEACAEIQERRRWPERMVGRLPSAARVERFVRTKVLARLPR